MGSIGQDVPTVEAPTEEKVKEQVQPLETPVITGDPTEAEEEVKVVDQLDTSDDSEG